MKFHKHMCDMRDLLRFKAYLQFNIRDFIPGITLKDVLRFEERNKNVFFYSEGNLRQYLKKK
jgi:hypothetical protein